MRMRIRGNKKREESRAERKRGSRVEGRELKEGEKTGIKKRMKNKDGGVI